MKFAKCAGCNGEVIQTRASFRQAFGQCLLCGKQYAVDDKKAAKAPETNNSPMESVSSELSADAALDQGRSEEAEEEEPKKKRKSRKKGLFS